MSVTDLLNAAFSIGMAADEEVHKRWITVMHRLAGEGGLTLLGSLSSDSRLDLLLRVMEAEVLEKVQSGGSQEVDLSFDILFSLSECWVLRVYEGVRAAWERMGRPAEGHDKMRALYHRLGLARMPIAKGEIQQARKAKEPIILAHMDGSNAAPYEANGSYIVPRLICPEIGAAMWVVVDVTTSGAVTICRRDLSDEFLSLFD